jgi:hypothetical protein
MGVEPVWSGGVERELERFPIGNGEDLVGMEVK